VRQGLATRNAYAKALFMLVFHALGRFLSSSNLVCPRMTEWFGRRDGLQEGNRLQDKSQQIIWLMAFGHMLSEWRGPGLCADVGQGVVSKRRYEPNIVFYN